MGKYLLKAVEFKSIHNTFKESKQNGFVTTVNARVVYDWLGVKGNFTTWIKRRVEKYGFIEHVDYCQMEGLSLSNLESAKSRQQATKEYFCVPDMVKQLAMIENTEKGKLARMYFLDCEKKTQEKESKLLIRSSTKIEFKSMNEALTNERELIGKDTKHFHYSNEANMINVIALGATAKQYREDNSIPDSHDVRDYLSGDQLKAIDRIQKYNESLIMLGEEYSERKVKLQEFYNRNYSKVALPVK